MFHLVSQLVGLGEPNIYHDLGVFYKNVGILLGWCLTYEELSGGLLGGSLTVKD